MKKRLLKKHNKTKLENVLVQVSNKFTITKKTFGDGYFIFSFGQNTVCHFTLKQTPLCKYGIWLTKKWYQIFGEHEWLIDKFKPSATYLSFENDIDSFLDKVKGISENSKLYFADSCTDGCALVAYEKIDWGDGEFSYKGYQCIREFNEETQLYNKFKRDESVTQQEYVERQWNEFVELERQSNETNEFDRLFAFNFFKELPNMFSGIKVVGIRDENKNGLICSPRYNIKILLDKNISQEDLDNLYEELENLVHSKNYSEEKKSYDHQFSLIGCYDHVKNIRDCNYKYYKDVNQKCGLF